MFDDFDVKESYEDYCEEEIFDACHNDTYMIFLARENELPDIYEYEF